MHKTCNKMKQKATCLFVVLTIIQVFFASGQLNSKEINQIFLNLFLRQFGENNVVTEEQLQGFFQEVGTNLFLAISDVCGVRCLCFDQDENCATKWSAQGLITKKGKHFVRIYKFQTCTGLCSKSVVPLLKKSVLFFRQILKVSHQNLLSTAATWMFLKLETVLRTRYSFTLPCKTRLYKKKSAGIVLLQAEMSTHWVIADFPIC